MTTIVIANDKFITWVAAKQINPLNIDKVELGKLFIDFCEETKLHPLYGCLQKCNVCLKEKTDVFDAPWIPKELYPCVAHTELVCSECYADFCNSYK